MRPTGAAMSDYAMTVLALLVYKTLIVGSGTICIYLGYLLYCRGVLDEGAELEIQHGGTKAVFRRATPPALLAFFGASMIAITAYQGLKLDREPSLPRIAVQKHHDDNPPTPMPLKTGAFREAGTIRFVSEDLTLPGEDAKRPVIQEIQSGTVTDVKEDLQPQVPQVELAHENRLGNIERRLSETEGRIKILFQWSDRMKEWGDGLGGRVSGLDERLGRAETTVAGLGGFHGAADAPPQFLPPDPNESDR